MSRLGHPPTEKANPKTRKFAFSQYAAPKTGVVRFASCERLADLETKSQGKFSILQSLERYGPSSVLGLGHYNQRAYSSPCTVQKFQSFHASLSSGFVFVAFYAEPTSSTFYLATTVMPFSASSLN